MKVISILLILVSPLFAIPFEEMQVILSKEHNSDNLSKEIAIFPKGRIFEARIAHVHPENDAKSDLVRVNSKIVEGKYLVAEFTLPNDIEIIMITKYDHNDKVYNKWVWQKGKKKSRKLIGIALGRSISWAYEYETPKGVVKSIGLDIYADDTSEWIESYFVEGKLWYTIKGTAKKIK